MPAREKARQARRTPESLVTGIGAAYAEIAGRWQDIARSGGVARRFGKYGGEGMQPYLAQIVAVGKQGYLMANKKSRSARKAARKKQTPQQKVDSPQEQKVAPPQESPKRWWHKVEWFKEHIAGIVVTIVATVIVGLITLFFSNIGLRHDLRLTESERDELKSKLNGWKFSEPLYSKLPGDVDFLVRNLKINKEEGAQVAAFGPEKGDKYNFQITRITEVPDKDSEGDRQYSARFRINAVFDNKVTCNVISEPMLLKRLALSNPIGAAPYEFYVFVEDLTIDSVHLTIARRRVFQGIKLSYNIITGANLIASSPLPDPILISSPEN